MNRHPPPVPPKHLRTSQAPTIAPTCLSIPIPSIDYYFECLLDVDDIDKNQLFDRGVFVKDLPWKDEPREWRNGDYKHYQESLLGAIIRLGHSDLLQQLVTRPNLDTKACKKTKMGSQEEKVFDASEELINRIAFLSNSHNISAFYNDRVRDYDEKENAKNILIKECFSILLDKGMVDFNKVISRMYESYAFREYDKLEHLGNSTEGIDSPHFFTTNETRHHDVMTAETKNLLANLGIERKERSGLLPIELSLFHDFDSKTNPFPTEDALIDLISKIRPFKLGKLLALKSVTFTAKMIEKTIEWYLDSSKKRRRRPQFNIL